MTAVKICGLKDAQTLGAAIDSGADFVGFVFYPPSPRHITPEQAADLRAIVPSHVKAVALLVDAADDTIEEIVQSSRPDMLQLHGAETPERISAIRSKFGVQVMKAIRVAAADDLAAVSEFEDCADWLLFDARSANATLPGGTGKTFDWSLLAEHTFKKPWMLSGGLTDQNVSAALSTLRPDAVDVSSGVESAPGIKNAAKIKGFISKVKTNG